MADVLKRLAGPSLLTAAAATVYTAPAATTTSVRSIHVTNTSAVSATVTLSVGADAAATRFLAAITVAANDVLDWMGLLVLGPGEVIQAYAGTTNVLSLTMSGIEST